MYLGLRGPLLFQFETRVAVTVILTHLIGINETEKTRFTVGFGF